MHIETIDLHFQNIPRTIAAYLVHAPAGKILIETGPGSTLDTLLEALHARQLAPDRIQAVIVTHIHFDHAGAAGWWTRQGIPLYVHHIGARHLIDPARLIDSATRIYGDKMDSMWGKMVPALPDLVTSLHDGDTIHAAGATFDIMETVGHARHHHTIVLEDIAFTGDAAGVMIHPGMVDIPAPPPEFDLEAWGDTVDRLQERAFRRIYPTHFGPIDAPAAHLDAFRQVLERTASWIKEQMDLQLTRDQIVAGYEERIRRQALQAGLSASQFHQYATANPHYMSVDGVMRYWRKRQQQAG